MLYSIIQTLHYPTILDQSQLVWTEVGLYALTSHSSILRMATVVLADTPVAWPRAAEESGLCTSASHIVKQNGSCSPSK